MAKVKDLLVNGSSRFIGKIYASDQFISQVANGTAPFVVSSSTVVANLNADMTDGLHVHTGRNNEVNKIVRTDAYGYIQTGYINTNVGTQNLAISRIFYEYNNDGYIRKMSPSSFFSVLENSGNDISITVAGQNRKVTVGYASNSDKLDGCHASDLTKFYLSPLESSAPASSAKSWFENTMPSGAGAIIYNVPGSEKTIIVGKSTGAYGHMLQLNYDDKYLRILRYYAGNWKSDDWEKISAGYADSAGDADKLDGYHANDFATAGHTHYIGDKPASDLSSTYPQGISVGGIYANGYPFHYGSTITAYGSGGYFQIAGQWNSDVTGDSNYDFPTEMYIRGRRDSYDVWTTWTRVLTDRNYNSYAPTLTGAGASGTWGISISGNADSVDSQHFSYSNDSNSPTYLWATNSNGYSFLAARGSISVNYANTASGLDLNRTSITTGAAGWYKLAYYASTDPRGSVRIGLVTVGGNFIPFYAELYVENGWGIINMILYGRFDYISKFRFTSDSTNCYIEGYFPNANTEITLQKIKGVSYVSDYTSGWNLYTTATPGSGTVQDSENTRSSILSGLYTNRSIEGNGFVKTGSSDSYILLGGGGHKLLSDFSMSHSHPYLPLAGGWMDYAGQIYFKGLNQSTSTYATIGYRASLGGSIMHHESKPHQNSGAFYIATNGCDSANDWGGLAIDNEGVTVFGAGDTGSVFRVLNEDNVSDGAQFYVTKSSGTVSKYTHSISSGLLKVTNNSNTMIIGSQTSSYGHIENSANIPFYFNRGIEIDGAIWRYNTNYGITSDGYFHAKAVYANRDASTTGGGVSLYSNADPMTYGIAFRGTGTYGIHGFVTSANDWATYLTMSDNLTRGWIFRRGSTNVASIAGSGDMAIGQHLKFSNEAHISTNRSTDYHYGYTFNLGGNAQSIGMYSGPAGEAGGVVISPDGCLIYNSSDCGYNLQVRDKDLGGDLTNIDTLTFAIEQGYYAWSRGGFKKNGSDDSYVLLGGGGHKAESALSVNYANSAGTTNSLGSGALKYMCSLYATSTYNAYKITTDWHKSNNAMPTINIRGYAYGSIRTIDCDIVMYHYENSSCNYSLTNKGSYPIRVWQAIENDVQVFYINPGEYFGMFNVFVYGGINTGAFSNWSMTTVDSVSGTEIGSTPIATSITGNADSVDGYHATSGSNKPWGTIPVITEIGWMDVGKQFEFHYDNTTGSDYSTVLRCTGNYSNIIDLPSTSGTLALTTDNVASASKWATPRTITLTGSVTGSVSIDGSQNVSLATTTNHTHNYAGSSSAGGSADSAITLLYNNKFDTTYGDYAIFQQNYNISDFPHDGWFNSIKMLHNNSYGYFTEIAMSFTGEEGMWRRALRYGSQVGWYKMLDSGNFNSYAPSLTGAGASGTWNIHITGGLTIQSIYSETDINSNYLKVYAGIGDAWTGEISSMAYSAILGIGDPSRGFQLWAQRGDGTMGCLHYRVGTFDAHSWNTERTLIDNETYNLYSPKLDGTGATGTWGINISGNAATATNAENISSIYPQLAASLEADEINVKRQIAWNNWGDYGYMLEAAIDFNWYETHNLFGVIRGGNTDSAGFGWMYSSDSSTYTPIARLSPSGQLYLASSLTISGAISGVTDITASGHAKVNSLKTQYICIECDNSGNTDGRSSEINNYAGPLYIQHNTSNNCFICCGGGNVGIGTTSPSYKLHVVGDIYTTTGFKKEGSSDSYVLLGGGGHKAISDFATSGHTHYIGTTAVQTYSDYQSLTGINKFLFQDDGSLAIYTTDGGRDCGYEHVNIQTCFDNTDPQTHVYVNDYSYRCNLVLQPRGGQVVIGKNMNGIGNTTEYKLRVGGSIQIEGDIYTTTGFKKNGSDDSYVLLGGGGHKAISDFATASHTHSNYIERLAWWNDGDSHNANDLLSGTTFAYHNHSNCPTTGTIVAFNCINSTGYPLQLQGSYYGEELWFRNRNGDNGTWNAWRYIIHNGNIGSQSVNYASSAGNADTVDNLHASNFVKFYLSPMEGSAPASSAKSWFTDTMPSSSGAIVYNVPGSEKTIIAGKSTGAYGHMLQLNYDDNYLRILRYVAGNWKSDDWEKISAGYADSAGNADTLDGYHAYSFQVISSTTASSVSSLYCGSYSSYHVTTSSSATMTFANTPDSGKECHIIIYNSGSSTITITLPSGYRRNIDSITIASGAFGEVNVLNAAGTIYVRAV